MRSLALIVLATAVPAGAAGPFSKFDSKPPVSSYLSPRAMEDVERCLLDMDGFVAPTVYRQPDRPDEVKLLWTPSGIAVARVDLRRTSAGTQVTSWMKANQAAGCAPGG